MPELGDFFVSRSDGPFPAVIRWVTRSTVNHAGLFVGDGQVVEALSGGVQLSSVDDYANALWSHLPLTDQERHDIAAAGRSLIGRKYGWLDVVCIGLSKLFGVHVPGWVKDRLRDPKQLFCSQTVDLAYLMGGVHLFDDGRDPGSVSPEDLRQIIADTPQ